MSLKEQTLQELKESAEFFARSTACLTEEDNSFAPTEDALTVRQQISHVAQTVDWFIAGIKDPNGFDMDFEKHWDIVNQASSLEDARAKVATAFENAISTIAAMSEEELLSPLPEGLVMGGRPKYSAILGIVDHCAHHRGALTVYARLQGKTPAMPYMDA